MIHSAPRRQIMRQQFPCSAAADCVEDAIENLSSAVLRGTASRLGSGHERLDVVPLGVSQVSVVRSAAGHRCPSAYGADPFQTRSEKTTAGVVNSIAVQPQRRA